MDGNPTNRSEDAKHPRRHVVQVHAWIPRPLKLRAFGALAQRDLRFTEWLREALEQWLDEVEPSQTTPPSQVRHPSAWTPQGQRRSE